MLQSVAQAVCDQENRAAFSTRSHQSSMSARGAGWGALGDSRGGEQHHEAHEHEAPTASLLAKNGRSDENR